MTESTSPVPGTPPARPRRAGGESVLRVDLGLYPLAILHATAMPFLHRAYVFLAPAGKGTVEVRLRAKPGTEPGDLAGEFGNELINQRQRAAVARRNERLRDLIVGRALLGAQPAPRPVAEPWLVLPEDDFAEDYRDDPLQIAVPWEERYGDGATAPAPAVGETAPAAAPAAAEESPAAAEAAPVPAAAEAAPAAGDAAPTTDDDGRPS